MKDAPVVALVAAFMAFWGFVLWVADAFAPWELVTIVGVVGVASFFGWVLCRAAGLADEREEEMRVHDWADHLEDMDWSSVRHGGLGR